MRSINNLPNQFETFILINNKLYHCSSYNSIICNMSLSYDLGSSCSCLKSTFFVMHLSIYHVLLFQTYSKSETENNTLHLQTLSLFLISKIIVMTHKFKFSINIKV